MIQMKDMLDLFPKMPLYYNIPSKHAQEKCLNADFLTALYSRKNAWSIITVPLADLLNFLNLTVLSEKQRRSFTKLLYSIFYRVWICNSTCPIISQTHSITEYQIKIKLNKCFLLTNEQKHEKTCPIEHTPSVFFTISIPIVQAMLRGSSSHSLVHVVIVCDFEDDKLTQSFC